MFVASYAFWGLVLVVDQLLLPMFHVMGLPYKVSYFLVAFWGFDSFIARSRGITDPDKLRDFRRLAFAFAGIIGCAVLGELLLAVNHIIISYADTLNGTLFYILAALAFGLGLSSKKFNLKVLVWVFYTAVALNLAFIFLRSSMPSWISNLYFTELDVQYLNLSNVDSVDKILELGRPRGYFSNPDGSALVVNIIALFIYLGFRRKLLPPPSTVSAIGIIFLPIVTSILLASRGEFVVSVALCVLNATVIFKDFSKLKRLKLVGVFFFLLAGCIFFVQAENHEISSGLDRVSKILEILDKKDEDPNNKFEARNQGITRPLLQFEVAYDRFLYSPLFGSGFSPAKGYPFTDGTHYFHNDWFRLIVTSGIIGLVLMVWVIRKFCLPVGIAAIIPWLLPGLVNTFMLNVAIFMFYFFMIGLFRGKLRH